MNRLKCATSLLLLVTLITNGSLLLVQDSSSSLLPSSGDSFLKRQDDTCEPAPITVSMCSKIKYNLTAKNLGRYDSQKDVDRVVREFEDLLKVPCAPFLDLFVCSMHLPLCNSRTRLLVRPCKEFCQNIKKNCEGVLKYVGHSWPQSLSCNDLPLDAAGPNKGLCLIPDSKEFEEELEKLRKKMPDFRKRMDIINNKIISPVTKKRPVLPNKNSERTTSPAMPRHRECSMAEIPLGQEVNASCAKRCNADFYFHQEDKNFANVWMLVWSVICLSSTFLGVATYFSDRHRFRYPELPIVWISVCYLIHSFGYILRQAIGPNISCNSRIIESNGQKVYYRVEKDAGQWCALVFLILYFSEMAAVLWWLILTVCWYLCAAKKWAHEALQDKSVLFHVAAWGLAALKSVILLILHRIQGDELTSLCEVSSSDNYHTTLTFVIVPFGVYLSIGIVIFLIAFCSSLTLREEIRFKSSTDGRRLEKLMTKISLFSFLYVIPSLCVLGFHLYKFAYESKWRNSLETVLAKPDCTTERGIERHRTECQPLNQPAAAFYMLKIFMTLITGLPCGLFVWFNFKSLRRWQEILCQCCNRRDNALKLRQQQQHQYSVGYHPCTTTVMEQGSCPSSSSLGRQNKPINNRLHDSGSSKYMPSTNCSNV